MNSYQSLLEQNEEAACVVNAHGRLLAANGRFCRLFGFENDEPVWHYLSDLYRHETEWKLFKASAAAPDEERHFVARLRNRKGRSFRCKLTRKAQLDSEGRLVYVNSILKIVSPRDAVLPRTEGIRPAAAQIFFTACASCHKVKDGLGNWIESSPAASIRTSRQSNYCPACAAKIFPGVFDRVGGEIDALDEPAVAVR